MVGHFKCPLIVLVLIGDENHSRKIVFNMHGGLRIAGAVPRRSLPGMPLVTIVTVVFNGAAHIEQAITSVLAQDYRNIEYLVIDGGSTDGTLEIINSYADRIDYWLSEPDNGIYDAMNKGLRLAKGELIGLLNADDFYEPDAVAQVVARYLEDRVPAIYYGDNLVLHDDLKLKYRRHATLNYWLGMSICHQAMFVHRDSYRELDGYREGYRLAGDYDFLLRAAAANIPMVHVPAFLVTYRESGLTGRHYTESLAEARCINREHYGLMSRCHAAYLASHCKTMALYYMQKVVLLLCGQSRLNRLKILYLRKVLLRDADVVSS